MATSQINNDSINSLIYEDIYQNQTIPITGAKVYIRNTAAPDTAIPLSTLGISTVLACIPTNISDYVTHGKWGVADGVLNLTTYYYSSSGSWNGTSQPIRWVIIGY